MCKEKAIYHPRTGMAPSEILTIIRACYVREMYVYGQSTENTFRHVFKSVVPYPAAQYNKTELDLSRSASVFNFFFF